MLTLSPLPYAADALAPHLTRHTLESHQAHQAHHVQALRAGLAGTHHASKPIEQLIRERVLYNDACQVWNHAFYWSSMRPAGGGAPTGELGELVRLSFGDFERFKQAFRTVASCVTPGWVWVVRRIDGNLDVVRTDAASLLAADGVTPILVCDLWEHAYYLDYQSARDDYLDAWWRLVDWDFAERNLVQAYGAVISL